MTFLQLLLKILSDKKAWDKTYNVLFGVFNKFIS